VIQRVLATLATAVFLVGCTGTSEPPRPLPVPTTSPTPKPDPHSLPALFDTDITGGGLKRGKLIRDFGAYRSWDVTFRSGKLTISGVLNVPRGKGPFPAVVLNHGYLERSTSFSGQGLERERDYLARAGFVVLHNDYRGHAGSDDTDEIDIETRLGYTRDAIAAVKALRGLPQVRDDQVALAGRSMGGGVVFNALVVEPDLVDAAVVWSPVSTRFIDNFMMWTRFGRPDQAAAIIERWGTVEQNPKFWAGLSARTYLGRIKVPVLMHHGTRDAACPYAWSVQTRNALRAAGVDVRLETYPGEGHIFTCDWALSMQRTVAFLRSEMGVAG